MDLTTFLALAAVFILVVAVAWVWSVSKLIDHFINRKK